MAVEGDESEDVSGAALGVGEEAGRADRAVCTGLNGLGDRAGEGTSDEESGNGEELQFDDGGSGFWSTTELKKRVGSWLRMVVVIVV